LGRFGLGLYHGYKGPEKEIAPNPWFGEVSLDFPLLASNTLFC
jgi:hypothetical protein